ncbi:hypothetical protein AAC387_Pa01g0608 [Persea americana]
MLREILTPSDTNNGGGFSVPRFCADSIFPRLNFNANPPMHNISIRDMHETKWEFWHIYRGTPRRHLLMTGWSKFINQKKLCAGKANCPTDGIQILWSDDMLVKFRCAGLLGEYFIVVDSILENMEAPLSVAILWNITSGRDSQDEFFSYRAKCLEYAIASFFSLYLIYLQDVFYIEREDSKKAEHQPYLARASAGESGGMA